MGELAFKTSPTLRRFARSDAFVRFIVGPVGSGKSTISVVEILKRAARQAPGPDGVRRTRFVVIRNTYSQLRDTTRKTFEQWVPLELGDPRFGSSGWHEQSFSWHGRWSDGEHLVETEVLFRALDRPEHVKKLLSLEVTGAYINEAREIPKHILDVLETRVGRYPSKREGGCTWFGIWADTNPWHSRHAFAKLFAKGLEGYALFRQPGGRSPNAENVENLPPGYYERLCVGKDREWIRVYVDGEDAAGDVGSIWGAWISDLQAKGGICAFDHPNDGVFTNWDLGRSDSTAIWFWRFNRHGVPDVVDHYEAHGEGLSHFFRVLDEKPYRYITHWLPHDARAKTLATQQSVLDQCIEHFGPGRVEIVPELSLLDGIHAARWLLEQPMQIHERCTVPGRFEYSGVDALADYRFEYDETAQAFSTRPLHNWASHTADAFRYLAVVVKNAELMVRRPKEEDLPPPTRDLRSFTMDELWEMRPTAGYRRV